MATFTQTPQSSDILATSQGDLLHNFQYLEATLKKDHQIGFNDSSATTFEGRHIQVAFNNRHGAAPTVAGLADGVDSLLYSDNGNVYFGSTTGAGAFQLTTYNSGANFGGMAAIGGSTKAGWTFLPGGLIMQYGTVATDAGTDVSITFPITFPNNVASIQITRTHAASSPGSTFSYWVTSTYTTAGFQYFNNDSHTWGFTWMAIGN